MSQTSIIKVNYSESINSVDDLKKYYQVVRLSIESRLTEFKTLFDFANVYDLFSELAFCILTANASAKMGLKSINALESTLFFGTEQDITNKLRGVYRFPVVRANYIVRSRAFLQERHNMDLKAVFQQFPDQYELRDYLRENIIGIGYKECSHFLRNVGFKGFAILDKHIISMLNVMGVGVQKPRNKREYKEIEQKMKDFAKRIDLDFDHLDLLFWSYKTGEIIK